MLDNSPERNPLRRSRTVMAEKFSSEYSQIQHHPRYQHRHMSTANEHCRDVRNSDKPFNLVPGKKQLRVMTTI
ncbi:unnamed protein product [Thelazia callipaeda]|uniref:Uncharacterized protein n=1 Tax=Thelazia callipaeda TaxID=103827 RepID=A0A0N5DAZ0_THECL|nr:unnamed protein product [Thelazia callipaeda]